MTDFPIEAVRARFPALTLRDDGVPRIYFDNPAGTQVPDMVLDAMRAAMVEKCANLGGPFRTSIAADALMDEGRRAMADMLNAPSPNSIVFGQNMTSLTLHMSRCLGHRFSAGDEIVLSRMDHDANVAPWVLLAEDLGLTVRWLDFDPDTGTFPDDAIGRVLTPRTKLVAVGLASNVLGTVNDAARITAAAKDAGALVYIDAVQFAPHRPVDVAALGCDFLVCSAYKFFGPHVGVLWGREDLLNETFAYKVRPAGSRAPERFETGTQNHEGIAGVTAAVDYLAWLGERTGTDGGDRRHRLVAGLAAATGHEDGLALRLMDGVRDIPGTTIHGVASANAIHLRVPTVSITIEGHHPTDLANALADANIFTWNGHSYGVEPVKRLGLLESGGVLRIGLAHYNTAAEVDRCLEVLHEIAG